VKSLKDALDLMVQLGYPAIAVFAPDGTIHAIVFASDDDALRITMAQPEVWEVWRKQ
jgi:hypothetical protein